MPIVLLLGIGALAFWLNNRTDLLINSSEGNAVPQAISMDFGVYTDDITDSIGWPYFYSKGSPSTPWEEGVNGVDCSGYALMVAVHIGDLDPKCPDLNTTGMGNACDIVPVGSQRPGDFALYNGHVMVVATNPGSDGHSGVIGASNGRQWTVGDNPNAFVKTFATAKYRDDFKCYMRWKPDFEYYIGG